MEAENKRIAIALSGGGIRATIFHLGVLKWMAENGLLEKTTYISSVSGASLCVGLVFSENHLKWPTSECFLTDILPRIEKTIMGSDIQISALLSVFPFWLTRKANLLARVIEDRWGIHGTMSDLERSPTWCVNCTTYETGKRFRITQEQIGDYVTGYALNHRFPIANAMAASAGFPILVGPYKLDRKKYSWVKLESEARRIKVPNGRNFHLWDGGVYDNLGLEPIYKISGDSSEDHLAHNANYIIVSNAGTTSGYAKRIGTSNPKRLLDIAMDQVTSLRSRNVVNHIRNNKDGLFLNIGNDAAYILGKSELEPNVKDRIILECLAVTDTEYVRNYSTTLRRPTTNDCHLILRHGYEVAKCTYLAHGQITTKVR